MRTIWAAVTVAALSSASAEADVSKAWQAAKDHLPSTTQMVLVADVAAIAKLPSFGRVFDAMRATERDFEMGYALLKGACNVTDPVSWVDGVVMAGDTRQNDHGVGFVQLTIDRTKASACLESMVKLVGGKKAASVKQDGIYTVATVGRDTVYLAWVAPNVVAFSIKPENKASLDAFLNQKNWGKSPAAALVGKLDPKAAVSGVFAVDKVDKWFPVSTAFGNLVVNSGTLTGAATATFLDTKAAAEFAAGMTNERERELKRDSTPAAVKKLFNAVKISTTASSVTVKGSLSEKELGDAFVEDFKQNQKKPKAAPVDPQKAVGELDAFTKKMCACKDKACANKVTEELTKWGTEMAKRAGATAEEKPDPDLAKRSAEIMTRYSECMTKAMMSGN